MSFTEDELQAFNSILEQRLSVHRREMERVFDQRMNEYRRDLDQRLVTVQRDTLHNLSQKISELENRLDTILRDKLNTQQTRITQAAKPAIVGADTPGCHYNGRCPCTA